MRIGLIMYGPLNAITGGYIYNRILIEYLQTKNCIVKVFLQKKTNFIGSIFNNFSRKLRKEILEFSPDILLQDEMNFLSLFLLNKKLKKLPLISIIHLLSSHKTKNFFIKLCERTYLKTMDGFIFNSHASKNSAIKLIGNISNLLIAYPGKDRLKLNITKETIAYKQAEKELMIIFIGNLHPNKGLHLLISALSKINKKLWRLSIIGDLHFDSQYTNKILKIITKADLQDNIKILGLLNSQNLKNLIVQHHVLAVPSYYESFGMVYAEAMGAGLPIIACHSGGVPEILNNTNSFLVEPGNIEKIKEGIMQLIEDRQLLLKMSLGSLALYENLPSWNDTMEKIFLFLTQLKENFEASAHDN